MTEITTLLVANRGEIAIRVMQTARRLGIRCVAVYSDADRNAPHVKMADEAVHVGPAPATESYLRGDVIIQASRDSGAQAIHPGYGFLSENAEFAQSVREAGLIFVGPSAQAISVMGDKARSKQLTKDSGVPCVPGYDDEDQSDETLIAAADQIGFPVMVKASAGGGGKGMRLVDSAAALPAALTLARSEAAAAFGNDRLIIEKAIQNPRHVEIQVFGDSQGNIVHMGERDCSVQRRHQKVIEEAPSPAVSPELRQAMGEAAIRAAQAVNYEGAGTVEFLLDQSGAFYFLEMNTRLQVEHPVTEMVTGLDLVALQLKVAQGAPLGLSQSDITLTGHAIEVRLYAEDPGLGFLPSGGQILHWTPPASARVDAGIETGQDISAHYDPMLAKIAAHGATRAEACARLIQTLENTALLGPASNRDFLIDALGQPVFAAGQATTSFVADTYGEAYDAGEPSQEEIAAATALHHSLGHRDAAALATNVSPELLNWSSGRALSTPAKLKVNDQSVSVEVKPGTESLRVELADGAFDVSIASLAETTATLALKGNRIPIQFVKGPRGILHLSLGQRTLEVAEIGSESDAGDAGQAGIVTAPMHGRLLQVAVAEGDTVDKDQTLAVLEAMKMQHEIRAPVAGVVTSADRNVDDQVAAGTPLFVIEQAE